MEDQLKCLGLYSCKAIENLRHRQEIESVDCIEGVLIDNLLLYNQEQEIFYLCQEYALNEWSSCFRFYSGTEKPIYEKWDDLRRLLENI